MNDSKNLSAANAAPLKWRGARILVVAALIMLGDHSLAAQADDPLLRRWVGTHRGRPLHLEFYGDSMLVVNDARVVDYYTSRDSLVAYGDTAFAVNYWFALGRLLLRTEEGSVVTMSEQNALARPITGRWIGSPSGRSDREVQVNMSRDGTARWRWVPGGGWTEGEWDRVSRNLTFTWMPDSTTWTGQYEPVGNAILFEQTFPGWGFLILRRLFRR
jgi:hypothetical protein